AGKAMMGAIPREAAVRLFEEIVKRRPEWEGNDLNSGRIKIIMTGSWLIPRSTRSIGRARSSESSSASASRTRMTP
ncbi:hypothetical protein, partial [Pseudomonas aeruginosa]|uniref:hypothetical protein n=1 Tax=Pseudomonas aeruginosa TaxID=287 RepID=UPI003748895E